jgi:hypothetical protein
VFNLGELAGTQYLPHAHGEAVEGLGAGDGLPRRQLVDVSVGAAVVAVEVEELGEDAVATGIERSVEAGTEEVDAAHERDHPASRRREEANRLGLGVGRSGAATNCCGGSIGLAGLV